MIPDTVGIDGGGTRLRIAATNGLGQWVEWEQKGVPPSHLPFLLSRIWKKHTWTVVPRVVLGSKGIWTLPERIQLKKSLNSLANTVTVMSDVELAMYAAFAHRKDETNRIFLVAGTGAIALGRTKTGALFRAGGEGPPHGDKGSGWWMGKEYLLRKSERHTGISHSLKIPFPVDRSGNASVAPSSITLRKTAALGLKVWTRAPRDPLCSQIIGDAQTHLARLILDVHRQMNRRRRFSLSWGGSWMLDNEFRAGVLGIIKKEVRQKIHCVVPADTPVRTAAQYPGCFPHGLPTDVPPRFLTKK
jgi:hypothetical protein